MVEEKILTINLRKKLIKTKRWSRAKNFTALLRKSISKKTKIGKIKIDKKLNENIWKRGVENPPHKIRVKLEKLGDGSIKVELVE